MGKKIQRVELNSFYYVDLHCPFCGEKVISQNDELKEPKIFPCTHTIFVADDADLEYRSSEFNEFFRVNAEEGVDLDELGYDHYDQMTDDYEVSNGIKFALYSGPHADIGAYVGFAPKDSE